MVEAVLAAMGVAVSVGLIYISVADEGITSVKQYVFLSFVFSVGLYFLVRLIHWAWLTPIPLTVPGTPN